MSVIPEFHTFREMLEHLNTGGAAYRYGNSYPIYVGRKYGGLEKRTWGGSSGELVSSSGVFGGGMDFTVEEQHSTNWVLIQPEIWEVRDRKMLESYKECMKINEGERQERPQKKQKRSWARQFMAAHGLIRTSLGK